jgi:hypothetical protein
MIFDIRNPLKDRLNPRTGKIATKQTFWAVLVSRGAGFRRATHIFLDDAGRDCLISLYRKRFCVPEALSVVSR